MDAYKNIFNVEYIDGKLRIDILKNIFKDDIYLSYEKDLNEVIEKDDGIEECTFVIGQDFEPAFLFYQHVLSVAKKLKLNRKVSLISSEQIYHASQFMEPTWSLYIEHEIDDSNDQ
ncbi:MAG: hypothetical protein ACQETE_09925 [Bacteroidota bacterium]